MVQVTTLGTVTHATGSSITIALPNIPGGATIFAMCTNGQVNSNAPVPFDSVNGFYTSITFQLLAGSTLDGSCRMSYFAGSAPISNGALTFNGNGNAGGFGNSMSAFYVTGLGPFKGSLGNGNSGSGANVSITTNGPYGTGDIAIGDLIVAGIGFSGSSPGQDTTNGFQAPFDTTSFVGGGYKIATVAVTPATYSPSGNAGNWGGIIAVFGPASYGAAASPGIANVQLVTVPQQVLLASLPQIPVSLPETAGVSPIHGKTYSTLKAANMTWHQYLSLREQGLIVEVPAGSNEPDVAITPAGIGAQLFNR